MSKPNLAGPGVVIRRWMLPAALATLGVNVGAQTDDALRRQLEQRLRFTSQLLADGTGAQRIAGSGVARAVAHLDEARVHQALAEQALASGDLAAARRAVDEALRHAAAARRLVPDTQARQAAEQKRYEQRLATIERLLQSSSLQSGETVSAQAGEELFNAQAALASARSLAGEGHLGDAQNQLARAEGQLMAAMNRRLHQRTLDYTPRAATPAEAIELALAQHQSLVDLLPLALADLKPGAEAQALVERYADTSRTLRQQALQRRQSGELTQALADLNNAMLYVHRALGAAGVALPNPTGSAP